MLETVSAVIRTAFSKKSSRDVLKGLEKPSAPSCEYLDSDAYYIFVIGYDLMQQQFMTLKDKSCDTVFDLAKSIWRLFLSSENEDWCTQSTYENLRDFINENDFLVDYEVE